MGATATARAVKAATAEAMLSETTEALVTAETSASSPQNMFEAVEGRWGSREIEIVEVELLESYLPYLEQAIARGDDRPVAPDDAAGLVPEVYYLKGSWVEIGRAHV